jgi:hypothetical protein
LLIWVAGSSVKSETVFLSPSSMEITPLVRVVIAKVVFRVG